MKDLIYDEFQNKVEEVTIRHYSLLDLITKLGQATSKTNRAVVKTITSCGCLSISVKKIEMPEDLTFDNVKLHEQEHLEGELCPNCREAIEKELGDAFFYIAALSNKLNLNIYDILLKEYKNLDTLGKFSMY